MTKPISVQLYSLREASAKDFVGVLKRVAQIGYKGVEPAGFYGLSPKELKKIVDELGMKISSSHTPWTKQENIQEAVDVAGTFGLDAVAAGYGPNEFNSMDAIKRTADMVNGLVDSLAKHNLKLFLHNHAWEFDMVEGRLAYDIFAEMCPKVFFEIDTYWASNFGKNDPAEQVAKFKKRALYLHIKDGPLEKDKAMLAVGQGKMDFKKVIAAADPKVLRWLVVELDRCDTDMFAAVEESYRYLVSNKLAEGNK